MITGGDMMLNSDRRDARGALKYRSNLRLDYCLMAGQYPNLDF